MRHVDDGTLHAWLDAELPDADAAAVASHLDGCARCRARLDEAGAVREQAGSLLEVVAPAVDVPDFDEVRARAGVAGAGTRPGNGAGTRAWRRTVLVAGWAASFAIAVALGWMARDWTVPSEAPQILVMADQPAAPSVPDMAREVVERREALSELAPEPSPEPEVQPPSAAQDAAREVAPSTPAGDSALPAAEVPRAVAAPPPPMAGGGGGGRGSAAPTPEPQESSDAAPADGPPASGAALPPSPRAPADPGSPVPDGPAVAADGAATPAPRALRLDELPPLVLDQPATLDAGTARFTGVPLAGDLRAGGAGAFVIWQPLPRTEAAVRTGMALYGLPDADPVDTAINPDATQVRTRYQLDSGDVVVLVQTRDATAPAAAPAAGRVQTAAAAALPLFRESVDPAARRWVGLRGEMRLTVEVAGDTLPDELAARLRID